MSAIEQRIGFLLAVAAPMYRTPYRVLEYCKSGRVVQPRGNGMMRITVFYTFYDTGVYVHAWGEMWK